VPTKNVNASWTGGARFLVTTGSGHALVVDSGAPAASTAAGTMELVLAATATCSGQDVVGILARMRQRLDRLEVAVEGLRRDQNPQVYSEISILYRAWGDIAPDRLLRAVSLSETRYCSVLAMLKPTVSIRFRAELNGEAIPLEPLSAAAAEPWQPSD
jgi:putative redox protein